MAPSNTPLVPDPEISIDSPVAPDPPPQEDLTTPVPLGEPADDGYVIDEEEREYAPSGTPAP